MTNPNCGTARRKGFPLFFFVLVDRRRCWTHLPGGKRGLAITLNNLIGGCKKNFQFRLLNQTPCSKHRPFTHLVNARAHFCFYIFLPISFQIQHDISCIFMTIISARTNLRVSIEIYVYIYIFIMFEMVRCAQNMIYK